MYYVIKENANNPNLQILHITGRRFYEEFMGKIEKYNVKLSENIKILPYFYNMPEGLNIADLVITSAGAITLSEISAIGSPSILIPKSYTAENHQEYNALAFEEKGASKVILEKDLTGKYLNEIINNTINNKDKLNKMSINAKNLGNIKAAEKNSRYYR